MAGSGLRPYRPTVERKEHGIHVRLTMGELLYIRRAAALHGSTISGYLMGLVDDDMARSGAEYARDLAAKAAQTGAYTPQNAPETGPNPASIRTGAGYMTGAMWVLGDG